MGRKNMKTFFVLAVLFIALFAVQAFGLPDNPPTCSLSSNTDDTESTAVLTSVSVDTLANAGVSSIKIYEESGWSRRMARLIKTKNCGDSTTCVTVKTVVHAGGGDYRYHAVCRDKAGQETRSGTVGIHFDGINSPPVITSSSPSSPITIDEDEYIDFRINAYDPDGDSMTYEWKVDGETVSTSGTSYRFSRDDVAREEDTFVVAVYVRDGNGGVDVKTWSVTVRDLEPEVELSLEEGETECDTFIFHADVESYDRIAIYEWTIDGSPGAVYTGEPSLTHQFSEDGRHTVRVAVMDSDMDVDRDSITVDVLDISPDVNAGDNQEVYEGEMVFFSGSATMECDADAIENYTWDFGDGSPTESGPDLTDVNHTYEDNGTYEVNLTVCDEDSCGSDRLFVSVRDTDPVADFEYDPENPVEGDIVNFTDTSFSNDEIVSWDWDFDNDGTVDSTEQNPEYAFDEEDDYEVCLLVTEDDGDDDEECKIISVGNNVPVVNLTANVTEGDEPLSVHFDCFATGGNGVLDYVIDFGDGDSENSDSADHIYESDGVYTAVCTVTDEDLDEDTDSLNITVNSVEPDVDLTLNVTSGMEPLDVHADCVATGGNGNLTYSIDFGDGTVVDSDSVDHTYLQNSTYEVICTVTDEDLDEVTDSEFVDVLDSVPIVDFMWDPEFPLQDENVTFDATIDCYDSLCDIVWDFGDGEGDTVEDPVHDYDEGGDYNVTLTVTDADGSVVVVEDVIHVTDNPPEVDLYVDPFSGDEPLIVDITCVGMAGDPPLSYDIDFGDGSPHEFVNVTTHTYLQNGTYNITCTVTDNDGDPAVDIETVDVFDTVPTVNFTYDPVNPLEGETVSFDSTIGCYDSPCDIVWDFGDGEGDTVNDPEHVYEDSGDYLVVITVTDTDGSVATFNDTVTVEVNAANVTLIANVTSGYEPLDVDFACVALEGNEPYGFVLDFGDGSPTTTLQIASHTYPQNGTYIAVCTVTDGDGDVSIDTVDINVLDTEPVVPFTYDPIDPVEGDDVDFDSTVDAYDTPVTLLWDFGDGAGTSTEEDPTYNYILEGDYNVTLTATDADGSVVVYWDIVSVGNNAPLVDLDADPMSGPEGLNVTFNCSVAGGNEPYVFTMDYGDGQFSSDQDSVHEYPDPGSYVATCTVTDVDGDVDSDFVIINVANNPPVVNLTADPTEGPEGTTVDFLCDITDGDEPYSAVLDFGDGSPTTTSTSASHTYPLEGVYTASCNVSDADGDIGYDEIDINITNNEPLVNLAVNTSSGLEPLSINYTCEVAGGNEPYTYVIDFGDGSPTTSNTEGTHDYINPGTYTITCNVTDVDGDFDYDWVDIDVIDNPPVVDLIADPTTGPEGVTVDFNCSVTGGNEPFTYLLDFGDGSPTSASPIDSHTYPLEGVYNASCLVMDNDLDIGSDSELIDITDNPPVVNLVTNVTSGVEPLSVDFNCTVGGGNAPFVYSIDFGDGSLPVASSTAVHTYAQNGTYDATCTVIDIDGDAGVDVQTITVFDTEPDTSFTYVPSNPIEGEQVNFTDASSAYDGVVAWSWDFGDGNTSSLQNPTHTYFVENPYLVVLTTTDGDGSQTSHTELINVGNNAPVVGIAVFPTSGTAPLDVSVNCSVTSGGNAPFSYDVFYGDGGTNTTANSMHTYTTTGVYPVLCSVTDNDGDVGTSSIVPVNVSSLADTTPPVVGLMSPPDASVDADGDVTVQYNVTDDMAATLSCNIYSDTSGTWQADFSGQLTANGASNIYSYLGLSDGTYEWNVECNDGSNSAFAAANFTFIVNATGAPDVTPPVVGLMSPPDASTDADGDVTVQYNVTDDMAATLSCDVYSNTTGAWQADLVGQLTANGASNTHSYLGLSDGTYEWNVDCSDGTNSAFAAANFTFMVNTSMPDVTPPVVALMLPIDGSTDADGDVTVQYNVTDDMAATLTCDIYSNTTGAWQADLVGQFTANGASNTHSYLGLSDGTYRWNVDCSDGTNSAFAPADFTFIVNVSAPDSAPNVTASADPTSGDLPLLVQFNATVVGGDAPLTYEWDFDNDGTVDSTEQNPTYIYNLVGGYTAVVNVTDNDGDWDSDTVGITVTSATHDIAVTTITDSKVGSTAYLWDSIDVTSDIQNQGTADENVTVELVVEGVVVDSTVVSVGTGLTVPVTLNFNATSEGYNNVIMRAVPVAGESDLSDQSQSTSIRVWSVEDIVSTSTREVFLTTSVVIAGNTFTEYLPIQNNYGVQSFDDLRVEIWSSNLGAFTVGSPVQLIDLAGGEFDLVQWDLTAVTPGVYVMSASLGNNEIDNTEITSKIITVV